MKLLLFYIAVFFCGILTIRAQSVTDPSKQKLAGITINLPDQTIKTQMLNRQPKSAANNSKTYMWYSKQKIMETKGGFDGKLIHGRYVSFYLNNQLKEKGKVRYGLKNKEWKYWYPDGKLKEVITWKSGVKNGTYELYNDFGQLMAKGNFKNDKLHGRFYTYGNAGVVLEKKVYKNGNEVFATVKPKIIKEQKPTGQAGPSVKKKDEPDSLKKPSFFKRLFKKKEKAPSEMPAKETRSVKS